MIGWARLTGGEVKAQLQCGQHAGDSSIKISVEAGCLTVQRLQQRQNDAEALEHAEQARE